MNWMRKGMVLATVCGAALVFKLPSAAQDAKVNSGETTKSAPAGDIELLTQAWRLADFAKDHQAPEAYIAAADLMLRLNAATKGDLQDLKVELEAVDEKGNPIKDVKVETAKSESLKETADGFFAAAFALGTDLKISREVETLIKTAKARSYEEAGKRGAVGGPRTRSVTIAAHGKHAFQIPFTSYSVAAIGFQAGAPLRIQMRSGGSLHFDQTTSVGNYSWLPRKAKGESAAFTVRNPHGHSVRYQLFTN